MKYIQGLRLLLKLEKHLEMKKLVIYKIEGLNNSKICAVNDVGYLPHLSAESSFPSNASNQNTSRKKEKAVPFTGMWSTYGLGNKYCF
jgi:hypothetical protein